MSVVSDIRQHLITKNLVSASDCKLNVSDTSNEQVVLWQYGGFQVDIGQQPTIQIKVLSLKQSTAEARINAIYDELINNSPCKYKLINDVKMWIAANQQPFFLQKDEQNRFIFIFNITVITKR